MLVLTRKSGQTVKIDNDITIEILAISKNQVRIGFSAPRDVGIYREEIYSRMSQQKADAPPIILDFPLASNDR